MKRSWKVKLRNWPPTLDILSICPLLKPDNLSCSLYLFLISPKLVYESGVGRRNEASGSPKIEPPFHGSRGEGLKGSRGQRPLACGPSKRDTLFCINIEHKKITIVSKTILL